MRRILLAALVAVSLPAVAIAQEPPKTDAYLSLVAAAVSGYSGGGPVYVVICETGGEYKIMGAFGTQNEAQTVANNAKATRTKCTVEGPYSGTLGYPTGNDVAAKSYGGGCKKGPDSDCISDSTASRSFIAPLGSIESVTLTYRLRDGRSITESFDPRKVEAIFFTMPAVDRMLIPYYVRIYGVGGASARRRELLSRYQARDLSPQ